MSENSYEHGYHDGVIDGKRMADELYIKKLSGLTDESVCTELKTMAEREKIRVVYDTWHKIYHYIISIYELLKAEANISRKTLVLVQEIRNEVSDAYLEVSDAFHSVIYDEEEFADNCRKADKLRKYNQIANTNKKT